MSEALLTVTDLTVRYGLSTALNGLSVHVDTGEAVFMVGPNGAGKTTLLRTVSGLEKAAAGSVTLEGKSLLGLDPWKIVEYGIAHVPQNRRCFGPLSVEENLRMGAHLQPKEAIAESLGKVYEIFPALFPKKKQNASELSGGQQQMVAIGRALMTNAKLIMLDEPSLGLAPMLVDELGRVLCNIRDTLGTSILLVEQNVNLALSVGTRGYMLQLGHVIGEGGPEEVRPQLLEAYLGTGDGEAKAG